MTHTGHQESTITEMTHATGCLHNLSRNIKKGNIIHLNNTNTKINIGGGESGTQIESDYTVKR